MVQLGELMMILELHRQGLSVTAIARRIGRDPKTVRKYIERGIEAPAYGPRSVGRPSKLAPYMNFLRERVTAFVGVPTMSWDLLESPDFDKRDTSSLVSVGGGGAPAPAELVRRVEGSLSRGRPSIGYGMTETNAYGPGNSGADYLRKPTSSGRAVPVMEIRVVDDDGPMRRTLRGFSVRVMGAAPRAGGAASRYITLSAPADSPAMVTLSGSPPNAAMLFRTQRSASIGSSRP